MSPRTHGLLASVTALLLGSCSGEDDSTGAAGQGAQATGGTGGTGGSGLTGTGGSAGEGGSGGGATTECNGNCHYVREGASGAADGSSWADAWTALPDTLELGQLPTQPHDVIAPDPGFASIPGVEGPAVADPAPEDFVPTASSPLRNAGHGADADLAIPAEDFFGQPRDDTPNIGAIE